MKRNAFDHAPSRIEIHCRVHYFKKIMELLANHLGLEMCSESGIDEQYNMIYIADIEGQPVGDKHEKISMSSNSGPFGYGFYGSRRGGS